jgi:8-oxo-dGTP pyrophosphatase MutT (NUDIX family)
MEKNKTISVWLFLEDGENKGKFVLQKRLEKHRLFVCQPAWSGGIEVGEAPEEAIIRECQEELGIEFAKSFNFLKLKFIGTEGFVKNGEKYEGFHYYSKIRAADLEKVKIHPDAMPDFISIGRNDKFQPISSGLNPKNNVVLFDDEYKILKEIINGN